MTLENIVNSLKNSGKKLAKSAKSLALASFITAGSLFPGSEAKANDIYVTNDYPTIQQAIDASGSNDVIHVEAGRYKESLSISNKPLTIVGSGTNDCVLYSAFNTTPIVFISGPGRVELSNMHINGGTNWVSGNNYWGTSKKGIVSTNNADLVLNNLTINQIGNYVVTVDGGSLDANNVNMFNQNYYTHSCDIGFQLNSLSARINNLTQGGGVGWVDHTVNINNPPANHSDVIVENSTIRANKSNYGDCIRTYTDSDVTVRNCNLYRLSGQTPASLMHRGVGINGPSNNVNIVTNTFDGVPWAILAFGSISNSNHLVVEGNHIKNCENGGIALDKMDYEGIDLGGGKLGSKGGNIFSHTNPPAGYLDFLYTNVNGNSTANIRALGNTWTGGTGTNKEKYIFDKLDDNTKGRLITEPMTFGSAGMDENGNHVLKWSEQGAGAKYKVEKCTNLVEGLWTPVASNLTNSSFIDDMCWTNTYDSASNNVSFYRIKSEAP